MKTKTKIDKQIEKKTNSELVETIIAAKKKDKWLEVAGVISSSRRNSIGINLNELESKVKDGELVVIPGKILSQGELTKKVKIVALKFSEKAREKLSKAKISCSTILEEIKVNPEARGVRILR